MWGGRGGFISQRSIWEGKKGKSLSRGQSTRGVKIWGIPMGGKPSCEGNKGSLLEGNPFHFCFVKFHEEWSKTTGRKLGTGSRSAVERRREGWVGSGWKV